MSGSRRSHFLSRIYRIGLVGIWSIRLGSYALMPCAAAPWSAASWSASRPRAWPLTLVDAIASAGLDP
jgi:hypothetical protein